MDDTETNDGPRVAIVTGGARGIGRSIAERLATSGLLVVVGDLTTGASTGDPIDAQSRHLDVSDPESCSAFVEMVTDQYGRIDILVNNAAINHRRSAVDTAISDWESVMRTNLTGTFAMCNAAYVELRKSRGCVVNIGSVGGHVAVTGSAAYVVSKAAIMHLTRVLAVEWAEHEIRVNSVAPALVATPMTADLLTDANYMRAKMRGIPLGRMPTTSDVAEAVAYLCSDQANSITGHVLFVDGGASIV